LLELRNLRVAHDRVEVLHGVDLSVSAGEVLGIIGSNGAGKSTLLGAICGLARPSAGEATFEGRNLIGQAPEQVARLGLSLVPEGRQVFGTLTVAENLSLAARSADPSAQVEATLERFPALRARATLHADRLSGGEQQQLAIARALLTGPKLLILDEPSLGLAPKTIDWIYELLKGLREAGMTMLLAEQNATRTIAFCDRTIVLSAGILRAQGTREQLQRDPDVLSAYLGRQL
jgi:branched-chain amino acid transport system ATP-binding protein